jgi:integrase/recombinase XerD
MQEVTIYREANLVQRTQDVTQVDAAFLATWLHGKSEKTQRAYTGDMLRFYREIGKSLQQVTLEDLQRYDDLLREQGLKTTSHARALAAIKSALTFGLKSGYTPFNVGLLVELPKIEDTLAEKIMSEAAVARMLALETDTRNHAILVLLYRAGLRCAELCDLQWRHVTPRDESGQLAIFGKGKKTRFVLLDADTWQELHKMRPLLAAPDTYVFQSRQARYKERETHRRMDESMIYVIVSRAATRAHIEGKVSPHWMRHAHATHSLENGAPITLVRDTLGHASMETTAKYTHVRPNASSGQYLKV